MGFPRLNFKTVCFIAGGALIVGAGAVYGSKGVAAVKKLLDNIQAIADFVRRAEHVAETVEDAVRPVKNLAHVTVDYVRQAPELAQRGIQFIMNVACGLRQELDKEGELTMKDVILFLVRGPTLVGVVKVAKLAITYKKSASSVGCRRLSA